MRLNSKRIAKGLTTGNQVIIIIILVPHCKYFYWTQLNLTTALAVDKGIFTY